MVKEIHKIYHFFLFSLGFLGLENKNIVDTKMTKLLVMSGFSAEYQEAEISAEIINLNESDPNLVCDDLTDPRARVWGVTGTIFMEKIPIICGNWQTICTCQAFQNGSWDYIPDPPRCRWYSTSAVLKNSDDQDVLYLVGGINNGTYEQSTDTFNGTVWGSQKATPARVYYSCLVKINSTALLSIGGAYEFQYKNNTYFYNSKVNKWTVGPSLRESREGLSCGILKVKNPLSKQTQKVVVVAGGKGVVDGKGISGVDLSSVELLYLNEHDDFNNVEWVAGPALPKAANQARMVEYNNSVILIGGKGDVKSGSEVVNGFHLYQLSSTSGPWVEMRQRLKRNRFGHVSFLVPDELVNCRRKGPLK
jgi:hypothetical protein